MGYLWEVDYGELCCILSIYEFIVMLMLYVVYDLRYDDLCGFGDIVH